MAEPPTDPVRLRKISSAYWRVTIDNPPINLGDQQVILGLQAVVEQIEVSDDLKVVVFDSADPDFFIAHFDLSGNSTEVAQQIGPTGLTTMADLGTRLSMAPVVSIASIRGRARGMGSEFALACDLRFASRESAILSQPEVGCGLLPGGGGLERLQILVGRSRAMEVVLGSDDVDAVTAELYGYINRAIPDEQLDPYVDTFARRIAGFDKEPLAVAKAALLTRSGLPSVETIQQTRRSFVESLSWPNTKRRLAELFGRGAQQRDDVEFNLGRHLADL